MAQQSAATVKPVRMLATLRMTMYLRDFPAVSSSTATMRGPRSLSPMASSFSLNTLTSKKTQHHEHGHEQRKPHEIARVGREELERPGEPEHVEPLDEDAEYVNARAAPANRSFAHRACFKVGRIADQPAADLPY